MSILKSDLPKPAVRRVAAPAVVSASGTPAAPPAPEDAPLHIGPLVQLGLWSFLIFLFLCFSRIHDFILSGLHLPLVTSWLAFIAAVLTGGLRRAFYTRIGIFLTAFTIWMSVDIPFSTWRRESFTVFTNAWLRSFTVFFLGAALLRTYQYCRRAMNVMAYAMIGVCLLCLRYRVIGEEGRLALVQGLLINPNDLAQVVLMCLPFWFLMVIDRKHNIFRKVFAFLAMLPLFAIVLATGSRGGFVTAAVMVFAIFWHASMGNKIKTVVIAVVAVSLLVALMPKHLRERYKTTFTRDNSASTVIAVESGRQRWQLLMISLRLTLRHPLFGVGPGEFQDASYDYARGAGIFLATRETHNAFTQLSSETGIPGLVFYVAALLYCLKEVSSIRKLCRGRDHLQDIAAAAQCLSLSLLSLTVFQFFNATAYFFYFPTLAGLTIAFCATSKTEIKRRVPTSSAPPWAPPARAAAVPDLPPPSLVRPPR